MSVCANCGESNLDKARFCLACGAPLQVPEAPAIAGRKTVTVVFSDLQGSTALGERLDPESLREVLDVYFAKMKGVLERHGGIVEKYIGDAIMAVFGLPRLHEDDAQRAVRAAWVMRDALAALNEDLERRWGITLVNRTGVNTGEVVVGDAATGLRLVTGDAVNVAARLEQSAAGSEILISQSTYRHVTEEVSAEAVAPLTLKGKAEPVPTYRLIAVSPTAARTASRLDAPFVGRAEEIAFLESVFDDAVAARTCRLVTSLGDAGVGKSRMIAEVDRRLRNRAVVVHGRCLSYGEGITFWPLAELIKDAAGISEDEGRSDSASRVRALLGDSVDADRVVDRLGAAIGLTESTFAVEEIFWAARRFLESLAKERPVVAVVEDVHWAETAFLDMVDTSRR